MRIQGYNGPDRHITANKLGKVDGQAFAKGDVIKGEILNIQQGKALIQLDGGMKIPATLTQDVELMIGQKLMFSVRDASTEQVVLKPMTEDMPKPRDAKVMIALEQAGLTPNKKNMDVVQGLIHHKMPVDKQTISHIMRLAYRYKDLSIDKLLFMLEKDIPVTRENITGLDQMLAGENSVKQELMHLSSGMLEGTTLEEKQALIGMLMSGEEGVKNQEGTQVQGLDQEQLATETRGIPVLTEQIISSIQEGMQTLLGQKMDHMKLLSMDMTIEDIELWLEELAVGDEEKASIRDLVTTKVLEGAIDKNIFLSSEALQSKEAIMTYFADVYDKMLQIMGTKPLTGSKGDALIKNATKVKDNMQFTHYLNQNYQYVQLPLKFGQSLKGSELFVFENKKNKRDRHKKGEISALLRLDYLNLGHMDIYIKKKGHMVDTQFFVEDEEQKKRLQTHLYKLAKGLDKFGLKVQGLTVAVKKEDFAVMDTFLQRREESLEVKRYSFDMRV